VPHRPSWSFQAGVRVAKAAGESRRDSQAGVWCRWDRRLKGPTVRSRDRQGPLERAIGNGWPWREESTRNWQRWSSCCANVMGHSPVWGRADRSRRAALLIQPAPPGVDQSQRDIIKLRQWEALRALQSLELQIEQYKPRTELVLRQDLQQYNACPICGSNRSIGPTPVRATKEIAEMVEW
jgi:hypothetical protein